MAWVGCWERSFFGSECPRGGKIIGLKKLSPFIPQKAGYFCRRDISLILLLMRYFFSLFVALVMLAIVFAPSCKKRDEGFTQALVIQTNDLTPTGCGYLLSLGNNSLIKPNNLPSAYWHDSMPVLVKYTNTGLESNCMPQNPMPIVSVDDIKHE